MDARVPSGLLRHLTQTLAMSNSDATRVVDEILHYYGDTVEEFVVRRHRELQLAGLHNKAIFDAIATELEHGRFRTPALSVRQIRRIIYG